MNIILSIQPQYVSSIVSGIKKFEFRKKFPEYTIERVYIYASRPTQKIVAHFTPGQIIKGNPSNVWNKCRKLSGLTEEEFFKYFYNRTAIAIEITNLIVYQEPITPAEYIKNFTPPQNYRYIKTAEVLP